MKCLVTGAAGFIGSHLAERLLRDGHEVIGMDSFTDHYHRLYKEENISSLRGCPSFSLLEEDLVDSDLAAIVSDVDIAFHLAGQPGVRSSWGSDFDIYVRNNILATQRLLEAVKDSRSLKKLVYASSSSVYGEAGMHPMSETRWPSPISPYGGTKLAGEGLCQMYWRRYGVPVVSLRYFTVYGPRQRPDMGIRRFLQAVFDDAEIQVFGDGEQTRAFTYVADAVEGTVRAGLSACTGQAINIAGPEPISINGLLAVIADVSGKRLRVAHLPGRSDDARHTSADLGRARELLGYHPRADLRQGISHQWNWLTQASPLESPDVMAVTANRTA